MIFIFLHCIATILFIYFTVGIVQAYRWNKKYGEELFSVEPHAIYTWLICGCWLLGLFIKSVWDCYLSKGQ